MVQRRKLFSPLKREILIKYCEATPALWNHGMAEWPDVVDSLNTLEQDENLKSPPSKKVKSFQESDAKAALWTALANSLNSQTSNL